MPDPQPTPPAAPAPPPAPAPGTPAPPPPATPPTPPAPAPTPAPGQPPAPAPAPAKPAEPTTILGPDKQPPPAEPAPAPTDGRQRDPATGQFLPKPPAIDLKLPEGAQFDPKLLDEFKGIMADPKLDRSQLAQALVEWQAKTAPAQKAAMDKAALEEMQRARVKDLDTLKGDPEFGGAFYDQTRAASRSILAGTKYGPAVSKKLEMYGLDCDPDFTKFLAEVRSLIAEDTTSSRLLSSPTPATNGAPMSQTARQAATYKQQPGQ